jgi:hypothetical protein
MPTSSATAFGKRVELASVGAMAADRTGFSTLRGCGLGAFGSGFCLCAVGFAAARWCLR